MRIKLSFTIDLIRKDNNDSNTGEINDFPTPIQLYTESEDKELVPGHTYLLGAPRLNQKKKGDLG